MTRELEDVMFRRAAKVINKREIENILLRMRPPCNFNCLGNIDVMFYVQK